ncbi:MAG: DUF2442 domain-containing protein [Pirellulaceae bacterium]|mgnify:FL=1|nr:DUF2442 domain-containing protein [Pirellulaceae bacterium]
MTTSATDTKLPNAIAVAFSDNGLKVSLSDGRDISVSIVWFPRLIHATPSELSDWRLVGGLPNAQHYLPLSIRNMQLTSFTHIDTPVTTRVMPLGNHGCRNCAIDFEKLCSVL